MDISQIGNFLLELLERYGITGAIIIAVGILIFKFGNKLAESLA